MRRRETIKINGGLVAIVLCIYHFYMCVVMQNWAGSLQSFPLDIWGAILLFFF